MSRSIIRRAPWTIGPDREEGTPPPARFVACKKCSERSEPSHDLAATDMWALTHTGRTGHREYREHVTAHLRVTPTPGNPLNKEAR